MSKSNPCKPDCPLRNAFCYPKCKDYLDWKAEDEAEKKALRNAALADEFLRTNYVNYMHKAEPHKSIRMYIHK